METSEVSITATLFGVDGVVAGFSRIGDAAANMGSRTADVADRTVAANENVTESTNTLEISDRRLMLTTAGMIGNSVQLGDIMGRMAKGQLDLGKGTFLLTMNFLQLGSQLALLAPAFEGMIAKSATLFAMEAKNAAGALAHAAAEGIRRAASWATVAAENARSIAHTVANALSGPAGWVILAGAAAAAGAGFALASRIPRMAEGGIVNEPTLAMLGERGPEVVTPLDRLQTRPAQVIINIYGAQGFRDGVEDGVTALRRAGVA